MNMGKSSVIEFTDGLRNICPYSFELHATNRQEVAPCMPTLIFVLLKDVSPIIVIQSIVNNAIMPYIT